MKNTAINTLEYTGVVTLSQYINSKKVKITQVNNEGGNPLFNFLSDCLIGDFDTAKASLPTKIMLLKSYEIIDTSNNTTSINVESRSGFIYLLSKPEKVYDNTKGVVRYSFVLSRDIIESTDFNSIGLYTNSTTEVYPQNYAAFCKVSINSNDISSSSILIVDWELNISNKNY